MEEKELDSILKDQLSEYQVQPLDASWEVLYDRLHGRKEKYLFFKIAATVLVIGISMFYFLQNDTNTFSTMEAHIDAPIQNEYFRTLNVLLITTKKDINNKNLAITTSPTKAAIREERYEEMNKTLNIDKESVAFLPPLQRKSIQLLNTPVTLYKVGIIEPNTISTLSLLTRNTKNKKAEIIQKIHTFKMPITLADVRDTKQKYVAILLGNK